MQGGAEAQEKHIPHDEEQRDALAEYVVSRPCAHVGGLGRLEREEYGSGLILPCRESARAGVGGDMVGEVVQLSGEEPCVHVIEHKSVRNLENDVHLERQPRAEREEGGGKSEVSRGDARCEEEHKGRLLDRGFGQER